MPDHAVTFTAQWQINTYDITWNADGVITTTKDVAYGTVITLPDAPTKEGYTFAGWEGYTEGMTMPDNAVTFTAKWTVNQYTITFNTDGGTAIAPITQDYNTVVTAPAAPTRIGYTFAGWDQEIPATMPAEDLTITAIWNATIYNIHFWVDQDDAEPFGSINPCYYGSEMSEQMWQSHFNAIGTPTKEGHTFVGWVDENGKDIKLITLMPASDLNVYAAWEVNTYTVTFTVNGKIVGDPVAVKFGEKIPVPEYTVPKDHAFSGWDVPATMPAKDLVLDAKLTNATYVLRFTRPGNIEVVNSVKVPYGERIADYLPESVADYFQNSTKAKGKHKFLRWTYAGELLDPDMIMPKGTVTLVGEYLFTGWANDGTGWTYQIDSQIQKTGWTQIHEADFTKNGKDVSWYYLNTETGYRATGVTRVPYPAADTGLSYGPNAEDVAYAEEKGITFLDKDTGLFVFGSNGKFNTTTGLVVYADAARWSVKGLIEWHPGLVKLGDQYYYFLGDVALGGNIMATGDVYVTRDTSDFGAFKNGVYTFGTDGKLCRYHGITDMANGTKRYYLNARLMIGNGLTKIGERYIYVRNSGELVVDNSYYVPENSLEIAPGTYRFDEEGFMVDPISTAKKGVYFEDGGWFYYEKGVRACGKGLISVTANWVDGENTVERTGVIYVRNSGQLATGSYYVTNIGDTTLGIESGDRVDFDGNGLMIRMKNGIVAENGSLYYYVDNVRAYNAGVIKLDGNYYYVRSNGELVHGKSYWITNVGNSGVVAQQYTFDANGVMQNPQFVDQMTTGIKDGYYYENGAIACGKGVVYLEAEGCYIYVRSNGQLATGVYWPTNTNGLLKPGSYDWGTDGKLYL